MVNAFDRTPAISPAGDGYKYVTVYDVKNDCGKTVKVTDEEADQFISNRTNAPSESNKKALYSMMGATGVGALSGILFKFDKSLSRIRNVGMGAIIGVVAGLIPGTIYALMGSNKRAEVEKQFLENNT